MEFIEYPGEGEDDGPGRFVHLIENFYACRRIVASTPEDGYPFSARVTVDPDIESGRLFASGVSVEGTTITSATLRLLRLQEFVYYAGTAVQWRGPGLVPGTRQTIAASHVFASEREHIAANGFDETGLTVLARIYRHALIVEGTPTKAVEEALGLSRPMARHWIKQARGKGFLGATEGRGKAAV